MRKSFWITLAVVVCAAAAVGVVVGANGGRNDKTFEYPVRLWGDVPYSAPQEAVIPNLLADMNNQELAFTVNDGDLKQGSGSPCDDALYVRDALADCHSRHAPNGRGLTPAVRGIVVTRRGPSTRP